jgi:hypothetical protein
MSPRKFSAALPAFRGLSAEADRAGALVYWMFTSWTMIIPKHTNSTMPSHRMRLPIDQRPLELGGHPGPLSTATDLAMTTLSLELTVE